jgi:hypothetical protein
MDSVTGSPHGPKNLIRNLISANVPESASQPSGHHGSAAAQQPAENVGWFYNHRQGCPQVIGMIRELTRGARDQRCRQVEDSQAILEIAISRRRKL